MSHLPGAFLPSTELPGSTTQITLIIEGSAWAVLRQPYPAGRRPCWHLVGWHSLHVQEGGVGAMLERAQQELSVYPGCYWRAGPAGVEQKEMARCSRSGAALIYIYIYIYKLYINIYHFSLYFFLIDWLCGAVLCNPSIGGGMSVPADTSFCRHYLRYPTSFPSHLSTEGTSWLTAGAKN